MRFACQSCGKAYNLPEERIADKSNVKLKCRVCGAIVEVKKLGEFVAAPLDEVDGKRVTRVSEAPAPLNSLTPEDDEADGATVSIAEGSLNERGPLQFEMPSVPLAPPTGFGAAPAVGMPPAALLPGAFASAGLASSGAGAVPPPLSDVGVGLLDAPSMGQNAAPLGPPPLSPSSLPPPPIHAVAPPMELPVLDDRRAAAGSAAAGSAAAPNGAANGRGEFFGDEARPATDRKAPELLAPVASSSSAAPGSASAAVMAAGPSAMVSAGLGAGPAGLSGPGLSDLSEPVTGEARDPMFKLKMLAAFATGVMVDRIISGLFQ
jgi:hypothetical protein